MSAISIVIPTLGTSGTLHAVLSGLAAQVPPLTDAEVIVVTDAAGAGHAGHDAPVPTTTITASTPGASAARNAGWRHSTNPVVLFLDDDIVPTPRLIAEHRSWHDRSPEDNIGVLGYVTWSPEVTVTPFMQWLERGMQFDYTTITTVEVEWHRFYSCNISVKRALLDRSGGFDSVRFPFGYEDLELGRRLHHDHGFRLLYNHAAAGQHLKTETEESWGAKLGRIATAEHRYTTVYPSEPRFFHDRFKIAADAAPARGRSARLARVIPPSVPWLGPIVWKSFDMACRQRLAPRFFEVWDKLESSSPSAPPITTSR